MLTSVPEKPTKDYFKRRLEMAIGKAFASMRESLSLYKRNYDKRVRRARKLRVRESVYLDLIDGTLNSNNCLIRCPTSSASSLSIWSTYGHHSTRRCRGYVFGEPCGALSCLCYPGQVGSRRSNSRRLAENKAGPAYAF